jgi:hypothetical protein
MMEKTLPQVHEIDRIKSNPALVKKWSDTNAVLQRVDHLNAVWCRSRTRWSLGNIVLTMGGSAPVRRMRQISAEIESRKAALTEAKYALLRLQVEADQALHLLDIEKDQDQARLLEIEIAEKEDRIAAILRKFDGAMRDVVDLGTLYDGLVKETGLITEDAIEAKEHEGHLHRAITQSIRDMRQSNVISYGNQEYLEQCGANPSACIAVIREYVAKEAPLGKAWKAAHEAFVAGLINEILN